MPTLSDIYNKFTDDVELETFSRIGDKIGVANNTAEDMVLQQDSKIIRTEGIGDCGPCSVVQGLLLEGILQNKKEFVINFLTGLFGRNMDRLCEIDGIYDQDYRLARSGEFDIDHEGLEFAKFISMYADDKMYGGNNREDGAAKFIAHFMRPHNEHFQPDPEYRFIKFIGLLLRLETEKYFEENPSPFMEEDDKLQFFPTSYMNLELMIEYLATQGIRLNIYRNIVQEHEPRFYTREGAIKGQQLLVDVMIRGRSKSGIEAGYHYETMMREHRVTEAVKMLASSKHAAPTTQTSFTDELAAGRAALKKQRPPPPSRQAPPLPPKRPPPPSRQAPPLPAATATGQSDKKTWPTITLPSQAPLPPKVIAKDLSASGKSSTFISAQKAAGIAVEGASEELQAKLQRRRKLMEEQERKKKEEGDDHNKLD